MAKSALSNIGNIGSTILKLIQKFQRGYGKSPSIIAIHFPKNTHYNTSAKRLRFIRKLGVEPIKRQHKTPKFFKYRIKQSNQNKKHFTRKIDNVNVLFEA